MTAPAHTGSPVARRRQLAAALRRARGDAGRTMDEAAAALECSVAKISRIETALVRVRVQDVRELADYYALDPATRDTLVDLARQARGRGWWDQYTGTLPEPFATFIGLEDEASDVWAWEPQLIPGLLQTAGYARAVMSAARSTTPDAVERGLGLRLGRQQILTRPAAAPAFWVVVDESALRRPAGPAEAWAGQLEALLDAPTPVTIQVLPLAAGPAARGCASFTVLGFPDPAEPRVAFTETLGDAHLVDDPARVGMFLAEFDRLRGTALDTDESTRLIRGIHGQAAAH